MVTEGDTVANSEPTIILKACEDCGMTNPPAGWYPSPEDPSTKKYWDGQQWLNIPVPAEVAPRRKSKAPVIVASIVAAGVLVLVVIGLIVNSVFSGIAAEQLAAEQQQEQAQAEEEAAAALAEQEVLDTAEREARKESIVGIEASVKKMAEGHIEKGVITGSVLSVLCSPVGGGSTDNLDQNTTVFQCFVATEDNGDGTKSGHYYNATMNWETGQYTYGFGEP